jgi:hypothetical protein
MKPQGKQPIIPIAVRADDAAKILSIGRTSLHNLMKDEKIPYTKIDRIVLFRIIDLENFLKPHPKNYSDYKVVGVVLNTLKRTLTNG